MENVFKIKLFLLGEKCVEFNVRGMTHIQIPATRFFFYNFYFFTQIVFSVTMTSVNSPKLIFSVFGDFLQIELNLELWKEKRGETSRVLG